MTDSDRAALSRPKPEGMARRVYINNPVQIAECGGPCWEGGPEACDCGALWRDQPEPAGLSDEELMELMPQQMHEDLAAAAGAIAEQAGTDSVRPKGMARPITYGGAKSVDTLDRSTRHTMEDKSQVSDGYHTFAELYEHRHALVLALMKAMPRHFWFSRRHHDGELCFGDGEWFIIGAELPDSGEITYHLPIRLWGLAQVTGAAELERGRPWDGHTAGDVVHRLKAWASCPAQA